MDPMELGSEEDESLIYLAGGGVAAILLGVALIPLREFTTASNFTFLLSCRRASRHPIKGSPDTKSVNYRMVAGLQTCKMIPQSRRDLGAGPEERGRLAPRPERLRTGHLGQGGAGPQSKLIAPLLPGRTQNPLPTSAGAAAPASPFNVGCSEVHGARGMTPSCTSRFIGAVLVGYPQAGLRRMTEWW